MDRNPPLTAADRCDRCGAAAQARTMHATPAGMSPLLWCAHHFSAHSDHLSPLLVWQTPVISGKRKVPVK